MDEMHVARTLAKLMHAGQTDKAGAPYFLHLERVAARLSRAEEKTVAFLHDIVEDTDVGMSDLAEMGFSGDIFVSVDLLTRRKGATYNEYIQRLVEQSGQYPLALRVKLADLDDHLADTSAIPDSLAERYREAQKRLIRALTP